MFSPTYGAQHKVAFPTSRPPPQKKGKGFQFKGIHFEANGAFDNDGKPYAIPTTEFDIQLCDVTVTST